MDVKTLCLGALSLGDASGYEIRKQFEEGPFSHFYDAGYGSIYPALSRLLDDGLVNVTEHAQEGKPDKKVYSLTLSGRRAFVDALAESPVDDKLRSEYLVRLFFAELLDPGQLARVFDDYLAVFKNKADILRNLDPDGVPPGRLFTRGLGLTFYEAAVTYMEENRDLVLAQVGEERARVHARNMAQEAAD